jgi:predicted ArsR family transcriptional regulator
MAGPLLPVEPGASLPGLSEGRGAVLRALAQHGEATAERLADELGLSLSGVRQQLALLEASGIVSHRRGASTRGRPRHNYSLTPAGDAYFPQIHAALLLEILGLLERDHPEVFQEILDGLADLRKPADPAAFERAPEEERLAYIRDLYQAQGFLIDIEQAPDVISVRLGHCPIATTARRYPQFCAYEERALQDAFPDRTLNRRVHRLNGAAVCLYELRLATA